ncbi:MAG: hypothetical protein J1F35_03125 [Erysipelotrichales bacterium]|nr:hypothetical protein [Erysipelotrichales bacterium]
MIEYIKEYGVTSTDYESIVRILSKELIDLMTLSEYKVREILDYYNSIGLTESISKLIINRPDLILIEREVLDDLISKIDAKTFATIVKTSIDDLIILGI